jgi:hypothetical protein
MAKMAERMITGGETRWDGPLEEYPLERYPDYVPGQPAQAHLLERFSYQDEVERIWGKKRGSQARAGRPGARGEGVTGGS